MKRILVSEDMSGAHESLLGFKDCEKLALVVLYSESGLVAYHKEYISNHAIELAFKAAGELVEDCTKDKYENEVIVAFYMFEGSGISSNVTRELYHKNPFSGASGVNDKLHNVSCAYCRWTSWGNKFEMDSFTTLKKMVVSDFYSKDKMMTWITLK